MTHLGSTLEWLFYLAIACGGILVGASAGRVDAPPITADPIPYDRVRLTAITVSPRVAKVRRLLEGGSDCSELWRELAGCDNEAFERLSSLSLTRPDGYYTAQLIIARWIEEDPAAATAAASRANFPGPMLFYVAVDTWADSDPLSTLEFLNSLPRTNQISGAYQAVFAVAFEQDEAQLPGMLASLPAEYRQIGVVTELRTLEKVDPIAALESCLELSEGESDSDLQPVAAGLVRTSIDRLEPEALLAVYADDVGRRLGDVPSLPIQKLYEKDSQSALDWLNDPEHPLRATNQGIDLVRANSSQDGPAAAADLILKLPTGKDRNRAILSVARDWQRDDADAAQAWARGITDEKLRVNVEEVISKP